MRVVFITGVSRGLGKALAQTYLQEGWEVIGIGRSGSLSHPAAKLLPLDLADAAAVQAFSFPSLEASEIHLIHNAGVIGEIGRVGEAALDDTAPLFQINVLAPIDLTNQFLTTYSSETPKTISFISSGAGRRPIASWSRYCASKAALDMFAQTVAAEQAEIQANTRVFSVAPGVVDTDMQQTIRDTDERDFSAVEQFRGFKSENRLRTPRQVADQFYLDITQGTWMDVLQRIDL